MEALVGLTGLLWQLTALCLVIKQRIDTGVNPLKVGSGSSILQNLWERCAITFVFLVQTIGGIVLISPGLSLTGKVTAVLDAPQFALMGVASVLTGYFVFVVSIKHMQGAWRIGIDEDVKNQLITSGIFSISRNPIYLAFDLYFIGLVLVRPSWLNIVICVAVLIGSHRQVLSEEKYLLSTYGEKFEKYHAATGRYMTLGWLKAREVRT